MNKVSCLTYYPEGYFEQTETQNYEDQNSSSPIIQFDRTKIENYTVSTIYFKYRKRYETMVLTNDDNDPINSRRYVNKTKSQEKARKYHDKAVLVIQNTLKYRNDLNSK